MHCTRRERRRLHPVLREEEGGGGGVPCSQLRVHAGDRELEDEGGDVDDGQDEESGQDDEEVPAARLAVVSIAFAVFQYFFVSDNSKRDSRVQLYFFRGVCFLQWAKGN